MAASALSPRRRESIVEPLTPTLQTMDDSSLLPGFLRRNIDITILLTFAILIGMLLVDWSEKSVLVVVAQLCFAYAFSHFITYFIPQYYKQEPNITSRLWAVIEIYVREMDNLLALMKLWESRSCQKVDDYRNDEDTMTRLRRFLNAMESLDLTNKIYELKDLSGQLNRVTKRLIRSPFFKAIDLIRTWNIIGTPSTLRVSAPSIFAATKLDDVKSIIDDLELTIARLDSPHWPLDTPSSQRESSEDARSLIDMTEETTRDIQSIVKTLQKKADLPNFGRVAVVSCWKLGVLSTPNKKIRLQPEHSPIESKLRPRVVRQVDERVLGWSHFMERVEVNDVCENGAYRGICKLCIEHRMKDETESFEGTGWLINNSTVVTAAHNLYSPLDESYAFEVRVQVGVTKGSYDEEMQWGDFAAIHWGYYAAGKRQNDMAMIKLKSPFHNVVPIRCGNAPLVETERSLLRVVGYPGNRGGTSIHQGRIMHVSEGVHAAGWDLKSTDYILRHHLDTDIGHSGCPLLKVDKGAGFEAIGIHAGGGGVVGKGWNEAVPLGHNANDIKAFAEALRIMELGNNARQNPRSRIEEVQDKIPGLKKVTIPL